MSNINRRPLVLAGIELRGVDTPAGARHLVKFELPATLGSDVAGIVIDVGSRVTRFKRGDAIFASVFDLGRGTIAEYVAVPESAAALKPANLDFVQAASLPMVALTSWQALTERADLQPGQKVFIPAGSGGIGTIAIQLAKHLGATVGTTTSTGNVALVNSLGADEVVDYKQQDFETVLRGYDIALGTMRGDTIEKSLAILKPGGRIVSLVGPLDAAFARAPVECRAAIRLRHDEPQDHPSSEQAQRRLLVPVRTP
ncbi:NADP-dependent oxidoreductase [Xanthomonas arboricola]|uniref:NADP-dependent oxidoreductase n=1 Tax=Xanthomonas arboricola TaxID=56448 RepID=UPI003CF26535